jgi:adenine-specific DNA-methyltransferase
MKVNGLLTFIIPMQLLKNTAFSSIRKNLLSNTAIHKINYVGPSIFEDANNDTIVIEYENIRPSDDFEIEISVSTSNALGLTTKAKYHTKQSLFLTDDCSITLSSASELLICDKLEKNSNELISENFNIIQGIVTGLNGAYIFDGEILSSIEKENLKPFLLGSDFKEYSINKGTSKQILYLDKKIHLDDFPNTKIWLEQFKDKLDKRREVLKGVIPWYSLQWPRDKNSFELPKIIFQKIRNQSLKQRLVGTFDNQCYFVGDGVIYLTTKKKDCDDELKYLLGLLNSEIYNFYYRQKYLDVNLKIMFLEKTPIITLKARKQIIYLVDKILDEKVSVNESNLKTIKKQIDQIIYDELGLSVDEVKIIETT